jgi:hypothetical protein
MAASALKPSAGRHRGERACLTCSGRVGQDCSFLSRLPTTHPTYHCPKALAITSYSMAFQVPGPCWYGCGPLAKPLDSEGSDQQHTQTLLHVIPPSIHTQTRPSITIDSLLLSFYLLQSHRLSTYHVQRPERSGSRIADHLAQRLAYHFLALLPPVFLCSAPDKDRPACCPHAPFGIGQLPCFFLVRLRETSKRAMHKCASDPSN